MITCCRNLLMIALLGTLAHADDAEIMRAYNLEPPTEALPEAPLHSFVTDRVAKTPDGWPNAGAQWIDQRLKLALENKLQNIHPGHSAMEAYQCLNWAVWAWLSPDSRFHGDERLVTLMRNWIDHRLAMVEKEPEDERARAKWRPRVLSPGGHFHDFAIPAIELAANPDLAALLGEDRVARWRQLVIENVEAGTTVERWRGMTVGQTPNIRAHSMAILFYGWVLTGERKYLLLGHNVASLLARIQSPNGAFPYIDEPGTRTSQVMYYQGVNIKALYIYWWHTGSPMAEQALRQANGYYHLRLAPPYYIQDSSAIWWKDQWRTFGPLPIAMAAAVGRDGRAATIALGMARDNRGNDRSNLVLGAQAYQLLATRSVAPEPRRSDYFLPDPDIAGLRGRFAGLDMSFSCNSYSYTLAGALRVTDDVRRWGALHLARPYVRTAPLDGRTHKTDPNFACLGRFPPKPALVVADRVAAAGVSYTPFDQATTWRTVHRSAPWEMAQLWLYLPDGMVGLMRGRATTEHRAFEICHQYRFILPSDKELTPLGNDRYDAGLFRLIVHATDLPERIVERERRYALDVGTGRPDWQLTLSDIARSPTNIAENTEASKAAGDALKLPESRLYPAGHTRFSLVEIVPADAAADRQVELLSAETVLAFRVRTEAGTFMVALLNIADSDAPTDWTVPIPAGVTPIVETSCTTSQNVPTLEDGKLTVTLPPGGIAVVSYGQP